MGLVFISKERSNLTRSFEDVLFPGFNRLGLRTLFYPGVFYSHYICIERKVLSVDINLKSTIECVHTYVY